MIKYTKRNNHCTKMWPCSNHKHRYSIIGKCLQLCLNIVFRLTPWHVGQPKRKRLKQTFGNDFLAEMEFFVCNFFASSFLVSNWKAASDSSYLSDPPPLMFCSERIFFQRHGFVVLALLSISKWWCLKSSEVSREKDC